MSKPNRRTLLDVFRFANSSDVPYVCVGSLFVVVAALGSPLQTFIYGKVFQKLSHFLSGQYASTETFTGDVRRLCGLIISVGAARMVFTWAGIMGWLIVGETTLRRARLQLFNLLLAHEVLWFQEQRNLVGSLTVVYRCIEEIRCGVSENAGLLVQTCASIVFFFCLAMYALWSLTLIVVAAFPLMGVSSHVFGRLISRFAQEENRLCAGASKVLEWCFSHPDTMRVLNGQAREQRVFSGLVDKSALEFRRLSAAISGNSAILKLLGNLVVMAALLFGYFLVRQGKLLLALVVTAFSACLLLGAAVSSIADILLLLNKAQAACRTIDSSSCWEPLYGERTTSKTPGEALGEKRFMQGSGKASERASSIETTLNSDHSTPLSPDTRVETEVTQKGCINAGVGCVSVRDVSYSYESGHVVHNVSADFSAQHLNFIVGPSGCGKSTLAGILSGFLQPDAGTVATDQGEYKSLSRDFVRLQITLVEPNLVVFSRLLLENLRMAAPDASPELLEEACAFAGLAELRRLPTLISENLSGGQLQKVSLARAFVKNSPVLIMDEALGSINGRAKEALMRRLREWRRNKVTILVTHDLSEIQAGDHVVHMAAGSVVCAGIHEGELEPRVSEPEPRAVAGEAEARDSYDYMHNPAILRDLERGAQPAAVPEKTVSAGLWTLLRFWYRTADSKALVWLGLATSVCAGVLPPVLTYCYSKCLSAIVAQSVANGARYRGAVQHTASVSVWALLIVAVAVAEMAVEFAAKMSLDCAAEQWVVHLRKKCLELVNLQDMAFFETLPLSGLATLLMNDTRDLRHLVLEFLSGVLLVVSLTIVGVAWAVAMGWKLALVGVAFIPLVLLVSILYGLVLLRCETAYKDGVAAAEKFAHEVVLGIRTVHLFALCDAMARDFERHLAVVFRCGVWRALAGGFGVALSEFCTLAATGCVLYYGVHLVGSGAYVQDQMVAVLTMLTFTVTSAAALARLLPEISRGQRAGTLIMQLVGTVRGPVGTAHMPSGSLSLRDVCFSYTGRRQVLRNVLLVIARGETVALTGPSGCGKLTMAQLVSRLYVPDRGTIRVSGVDIQTVDMAQYRRSVYLDLQEPHFFEASVWENLTYGADNVSEAQVVRCIQDANADFVLLPPEGLHSVMSGGTGFSLGQLRRLAIARALLRDPSVLIFDEPTARMDVDCTEAFSCMLARGSALRTRRPELTIIVVTHHLQVMACCERVVLLDAGSVVADGTFDALVAENGPFAEYVGWAPIRA